MASFLLSPPGVYRPQSDTDVLIRALERAGYADGSDVLDLGTGTGAVALAAARSGARSVTAVDLSRRSVLAARLNAWMHRLPVTVRRGDLFGPVAGRRFGLLTANPPYVPAETDVLPRYGMARCWDAGPDGRALLDRICDVAADHLVPGGALLLVHTAGCGADATVERLAAAGITADVRQRVRVPLGPVMRARSALHEARGLVEPGAVDEELVVIGGRRAG
ncbi:HemK2/MTQ2 family protein methyltransferase [Pseudonocardia endophytica]|uniref:Release factor glutamine methyltransferase n=1 Tax=Pseudonocardia endophytica TaxID=401976 RepID=A0A4R1HVF1_PSEEN|nr:HemK2/MTQ2 family protein methyltransferase [Pseudonocardia endophytica]TCK26727.1 release factor glutamine methyltransferase [Pseudonocardia endophytica]